MTLFKYLIIGGGMTADSAARGIRQVDPDGSIALLSNEPHPPYNRPPLSKGLWKGKPVEQIWRQTEKRYKATLFLDTWALSINPDQKSVTTSSKTVFSYEKLLIATGGSPRQLPCQDNRVIYLKTYSDYLNLKTRIDQNDDVVVIGAGFTGMEISAALTQHGKRVSLVFPAEHIGHRAFPADLAHYVTQYYLQKGVTLMPSTQVVDILPHGEKSIILTRNGQKIETSTVVAAIGNEPNTTLAETAHLKIDNGIVVDEYLRTSHVDIYAAGDIANFYNPALNQRLRAEHEDNSNAQGKLAGRNMAGESEPYTYLPFFYSDIFDLGYEAIGDTNPALDTVFDWVVPYQKGVIYYLRQQRVCGILLWNM
ncbi:MAG: NAD(P)/FAD-dependent oxidoreductase, partial [Pseudomonadota bacterium]|nr:NAD(P)/FAD-dependent oxidoreductase [Pseudomonadota bacterium]